MSGRSKVLAKGLCHNLTCIVHAIAEFGIDVGFSKSLASPSLFLPNARKQT